MTYICARSLRCMLENVTVSEGMEYYVKREQVGLEEDTTKGNFDPLRRWVQGTVASITPTHFEVSIDSDETSTTRVTMPSENVNVEYQQLLESGKTNLRCVQAAKIDDTFWGAGSGKTNAAELSEAAIPGDVDYFVSCNHCLPL